MDDVEVATDRPCHCRTFQPQISKNVVALGTVLTLFSMTIHDNPVPCWAISWVITVMNGYE